MVAQIGDTDVCGGDDDRMHGTAVQVVAVRGDWGRSSWRALDRGSHRADRASDVAGRAGRLGEVVRAQSGPRNALETMVLDAVGAMALK